MSTPAPSTPWQNTTGAVAYQFVASLVATCARCLPFHGQISSTPWPLGMHQRCVCDQVEIPPGDLAPFPVTPLPDLVQALPIQEQERVLGKTVQTLVQAGLVKVRDAVTAKRIRSAGEVVDRSKLTDAQIHEAGVKRVPPRETRSSQELDREHDEAQARELERLRAAHGGLASAIKLGLAAGTGGTGLVLGAAELGQAIAAWRRPTRRETGANASASTLIHEASHE